MNTRDKVLLALGLFIAAFIIAMVAVFCIYGSTPDTLIQYTLGAGGLEALLLAIITVSKVVTNKSKEAETDDGTEEENYIA